MQLIHRTLEVLLKRDLQMNGSQTIQGFWMPSTSERIKCQKQWYICKRVRLPTPIESAISYC